MALPTALMETVMAVMAGGGRVVIDGGGAWLAGGRVWKKGHVVELELSLIHI